MALLHVLPFVVVAISVSYALFIIDRIVTVSPSFLLTPVLS